MTRWRHCSERCGSARSFCCPAGPSPRARSSGLSAIWRVRFLPLRFFDSITDVGAQHDRWAQEVAFERHHRRVGAKVAAAWAAEQNHLYPLPDPLPDTDRRVEVRVSRDGFCRNRRC